MNAIVERAAVAWPLLIAETITFGTAALCTLITPASEKDSACRFESFWRVSALVVLMTTPVVLLKATADMARVSLPAAMAMVPQVVRQTHLGHVWSFSVALTVALVAAAWLPIPLAVKSLSVCVLAAALLLCGSLVSHAVDRGAVAVGVHFIHQLAAALWLGAIVGLWLGAGRGARNSDWLRRAAPRVSRLAAWTVAVLLFTGLWTAYYGLGADPERLVDTLYGRTLLVKVGAASLALFIGAGNRYRVLPALVKERSRRALLRNVSVESLLLIGVLAVAALLANTPPAH